MSWARPIVGQPIGMGHEGDGVEELGEGSDRVVRRARPAFLHHDLPLRVDLSRCEEKVPHPVSLELEHQVELLGRDGHVVHGDVAAGEGVVLAAHHLDQLQKTPGPYVGVPLNIMCSR